MEDINNSDFSETDDLQAEPTIDDIADALSDPDDLEDNTDYEQGLQEVETQASDEDAQSDEQESQEQAQEEQVEDPVLFVDTDGTEITRSRFKDMKDGNLRHSDYTRKRQVDAERAREVEAFHTALQQREAQAQQELDLAIAIAQQRMPQPPDQDLLSTGDPTDQLTYHNQLAAYNAQAQELQRAMDLRDQRAAQMQQRQAQEQQQIVQREVQMMQEKHPEFRDAVKLQEFQAKAVPALEKYGFSAQELSEVNDHRLIGLIKDVMELQKLRANTPKAQSKARNAPPVKKPGRQRTDAERRGQDVSDRVSKLRRTGDLRDAASALETFDI